MAETKPRAEQIRFVSDETGAHILDEYIEQAERGGMTIGDLLDILFDSSGNIQIGLFQFRIEDAGSGNYNLQFRVGSFVDPDEGWNDISEDVFTQILAAANTAKSEAQTSASTATTQSGLATTAATTATTQAGISTTAATNSSTSASLSQDWASKSNGQVAATDYSAKAWAVGGTGTTTNNAKYWAEQSALYAGSGLMKVSSNDTTAGYANGKLVAGPAIVLNEQSDGGNEALEIRVSINNNTSLAGSIASLEDTYFLINQSLGHWHIKFKDVIKGFSLCTEETSPDLANDFLLLYDASAGEAKKVKPSRIAGSVLQTAVATTTTIATVSSSIPYDNTKPQKTEGTEILTVSITPKFANSKILIKALVQGGHSGDAYNTAALFQDSTADAFASGIGSGAASGRAVFAEVVAYIDAVNTTARTYKLRCGTTSGTWWINGTTSGGALHNGACVTSLIAQEIAQ